MIQVDVHDSEPPFEQVRRQVAAQAADGTLAAGHRLPTVRALAEELGLAANTVAKAYRALEADGAIETHGRRGTFVAAPHLGDADAATAAREYAAGQRRRGLSLDEALRLVEQEWTP